jgi:hypothetical protein
LIDELALQAPPLRAAARSAAFIQEPSTAASRAASITATVTSATISSPKGRIRGRSDSRMFAGSLVGVPSGWR